jgi:putative DNA primase/helicase
MAGAGPDPSPCLVTFFADYAAAAKHEMVLDLDDLVRRIRTTTGPTKAALPWLKLARFGDARTAKGSLRHDGNMLSISGIEADYDDEMMSVDEAVTRLGAAGVLAVVYTSPSHTPDERDRFLARLNGLFGGIFANESWTRSQSYYYGSINHSPAHRVEPTPGTPIDLISELDMFAIRKPEKPKPNGANGAHHGPATPPAAITDKRINGLIQSLLDNIRNAADGNKYFTLRDIAFTIGGYLHLTTWSEGEAVEACVAALPSAQDWDAARKTAAAAIAAGALKPLDLPDRPEFKARTNGHGIGPVPGVPPVGDPIPPPVEAPPDAPGGGGDGPPDPPPPDDDKGGEDPPEEWNQDIPDPLIEAGALITEQEAMRLFINIHHEQLRFNHSSGGWLIWQEHFWKPDERKLAFSWALELCRTLAKQVKAKDPQKARLVIEKVRFSGAVEQGARAMPQVATAQTDWDADPMLLGTPGGVVDLATGILRPGTHADMISRTTSLTPSLMPECPHWIEFLTYAMHDDEQLVRFIQRYFGYCLTGVVIEEVFLFMFGPGGAGKGTMVETIASILGDYASTVPMEVFTGQSWSPTEYYRANMAGQRLVVANEPERGSRWAEAFIKETTGGDMLSGRHPMGRPFRFKPSHKMAMQGNHMPTLKGKSTGMERRLRILPVTRKPVTPDPHLKAKLITEGPGILRWLIEGCLAWQKIGLNPPDAVLAAGSKYFEAQDVFTRWIEDRCILDRYAEHTPSELRASYNAWAKANGEDEMNGNAFAEAIDQFECEPPITRNKTNGKRLIKGIRIMPLKTNNSWDNS